MSKRLYFTTDSAIEDVFSVSVNESHSSPVTVVTLNCRDHDIKVGDLVTITFGYSTNYAQIFRGYVRQIEKKIPEGSYTITLHDFMCRAVDFFIAPDNPNQPFKRRNILAEILVRDVLALAGLTDYTYDPTYFTLAINVDAEVKLISAYDYCKSIADLVTWTLWADQTGKIHFENRKPYVMTGDSGQVGDDIDERIITPDFIITDSIILGLETIKDESNLRNKVTVYGDKESSASRSSSTSFDPEDGMMKQILPSGFYKTAVIASSLIPQNLCDDIAEYNLRLYNRLSYGLSLTVEGLPDLHAREIIRVNSTTSGINMNFYIYGLEHNFGNGGFTTKMVLRR
jgi:hypothetical protein